MSRHIGVESGMQPTHPSGDGLDDDVWRRLVAILSAAHRGDGHELVKLLHSYERAMTSDQRFAAGAYAAYILRFRVIEPIGRRPEGDDLREVTTRIYPRYSRLIREPVATLEDALRSVFLMPQADSDVKGARLFISVAAAAGILLDDPASDLESMRPRIARWRARDAGAKAD